MRYGRCRVRIAWVLASMFVAGASLAREATWRGQPISAWIDVGLADLDDARIPTPPWGDSSKAMRRWAQLFVEGDDPATREEAYFALLEGSGSEARRALLLEGLDQPALADGAAGFISLEPLTFPDLVPTIVRRTPDASHWRWSIQGDLETWRSVGILQGDAFVLPDQEQFGEWLMLVAERPDMNRASSDAFRALEACGSFIEPALRRFVVGCGSEPVPPAWIGLLGERATGSVDAHALLGRLLGHPDACTREHAAMACRELRGVAGAAFVEPLIALALDRSTDPEARAYALFALGEIGARGRRVVPVLAALLEDADPDVRHTALEEIGNWGPLAAPHARRLARRALDAEDEEEDDGSRWTDADAALLGLRAMRGFARPAIPVLSDGVLASERGEENEDAAEALAWILGPERLADLLRHRDPRRHELGVRCIYHVAEGASCVTGRLPRGMKALIAVLGSELASSDESHRGDAVWLISGVSADAPRFRPAILAGLASVDDGVRRSSGAAMALLAGDDVGSPYWIWDQLSPWLDVPATRPLVLGALAKGAVPGGREAAIRLAEIASSGSTEERELALGALAWHLLAAPEIVIPAARTQALAADPCVSRVAVAAIVKLPCFPDAERDAILSALTPTPRPAAQEPRDPRAPPWATVVQHDPCPQSSALDSGGRACARR
jgi:HEAT repeat protein